MKLLQVGLFFLVGLTVAMGQDSTTQPPADNPDSVALAQASREGNMDQVRALIFQGVSIDDNTGKFGITPMTNAAEAGHLEVLQYLIDKGGQIDHTDHLGCTPLLHACWTNQTDCALALIKAGANVNLASRWKQTPLMYAADKGNDVLIAALIAAKANVNDNCVQGSAAFWAVGSNKLSSLKLLGAAGANLNLMPEGAAPDAYTLLAKSAADGENPDTIDYIIGQGIPVDVQDADGGTPLMAASAWDKVESAVRLLEKGAKIDAQDNEGDTALMRSGVQVATQVLLRQNANTEIKNKKGQTALMLAAQDGKTDLVQALIDKGADVDATDADGETALTLAGDRGEVAIVTLLAGKGAKQTDVHIIVKSQPAETLPPARAWALAVGQIYTQRNGADPKVLGGGEKASNAQDMLKHDWGIHDNATLLKELDDLRDRGHHVRYQAEGARLAVMSDDDFKQFLADHSERTTALKAMRSSYLTWKERSGTAWDICRSSMLVSVGYAAGYINEDDAWARLAIIAQQAQTTFGSWQEMSDNFLDGREIWADERDPRFAACAKLLLDPQESNSPWIQNPWTTDLSTATAGP